MQQKAISWPQVYIAVALTTMATLIMELSLTRIYSVVFYYHFAFLAISIALFGLGAGGVFSYVVAGWKGKFFAKLGGLCVLNSLLVVGSLAFVLARPGGLDDWVTAAVVYFASAVPFFIAGSVISLAIAETIERVDRVYFFDLIGAAVGCLLFVPLLNHFGGPNTVILAAALYGAAAAIWYNLAGSARGRVAGVAVTLLLVALSILNVRLPIIDLTYAKGRLLENEVFVKWNSFSRIAVLPEESTGRIQIQIDADASTEIPTFDFDKPLLERDRHGLLYQGPGFPYAVRPGAKALIIGPGGGWDCARALASGSKDITGVEINPIIATTIMQERFPDLSHRLYFRPEIRIVVEDGRSFVRRATENYQVIQATLVDTWAATAAGAFALSENNLYTTDAFYDYLSHLTSDGVLAFTRWGLEPPRESLRLISLARVALAKLGQNEPGRNVIVVREGDTREPAGWGAQDTILISRTPFTLEDLARARHGAAEGKLQTLYLPGERIANPFTELLLSDDPRSYERNYRYDISPVSDNRPFFFYTTQARDIASFLTRASTLSPDYRINSAVPLLFGLMAVSILAAGIILALPPFMLGSSLPRERSVLGFLPYFVFLGAGYVLVEVALIQKFVLFLGHPTYALTVVIFSMLVSSGIGSFWSRRVVAGSDARLGVVLACAAALTALLGMVVGPMLGGALRWPFWLKVAATVAFITPSGFLMGIPFPTGLAWLAARHNPSVRWAWALNAASSVLGSVGAIMLAIYLGFRETLLIGGLMYCGALMIIKLAPSKSKS
jgi:hypothetical protein